MGTCLRRRRRDPFFFRGGVVLMRRPVQKRRRGRARLDEAQMGCMPQVVVDSDASETDCKRSPPLGDSEGSTGCGARDVSIFVGHLVAASRVKV